MCVRDYILMSHLCVKGIQYTVTWTSGEGATFGSCPHIQSEEVMCVLEVSYRNCCRSVLR